MKTLYQIKNLICEYPGTNQKVLEVIDLKIPKNELVVILGLSGIGKSTILETLALMNNTVKDNSDTLFKFFATSNGSAIDFIELWKANSDSNISNVRNRHFSFIFQDANFMPSFTAKENMYLTLLLQGESKNEAEKKINHYLKKLKLEDVVNKEKKIYELSGGQKQRIAFIRAIAPDFTVLFGDEPTGNLDVFSAEILMDAIKENIIKTNKTAIIVSHDINLSLKYADKLVLIQSRHEKDGIKKRRYGYIDGSSVYQLKNNTVDTWINNGEELTSDQLKEKIQVNLNLNDN